MGVLGIEPFMVRRIEPLGTHASQRVEDSNAPFEAAVQSFRRSTGAELMIGLARETLPAGRVQRNNAQIENESANRRSRTTGGLRLG